MGSAQYLIDVRCDPAPRHPFLVKGGEDLRLDQRIEQLFDTMNDIFDADPACCQRSIRIRSYAVVPMGTIRAFFKAMLRLAVP